MTQAAFYILLALVNQEQHGYGIMKQADRDSNNHVHLGPGTLYSTIKRLLEDDLIQESSERPDPGLDDQRRRYYRITTKGQAALGAELNRLDHALSRARQLGAYPNHRAGFTQT